MGGLAVTPKTLRNFGLLIFLVGELAGALALHRGASSGKWFATAGLGFLAAGLLAPSVLRLPYRLWMAMSAVMGWFTTRIVLVAAFLIVITPLGVLMRVLGKDLLDERIRHDLPTYWKPPDASAGVEQYKKQF